MRQLISLNKEVDGIQDPFGRLGGRGLSIGTDYWIMFIFDPELLAEGICTDQALGYYSKFANGLVVESPNTKKKSRRGGKKKKTAEESQTTQGEDTNDSQNAGSAQKEIISDAERNDIPP